MQILDNAFVKGALLALSVSGVSLGGGAVLTSVRTDAIQDKRLEQVEALASVIQKLNDNVNQLNIQTAVLNEHMKDMEKHNEQQSHR